MNCSVYSNMTQEIVKAKFETEQKKRKFERTQIKSKSKWKIGMKIHEKFCIQAWLQ